MRNIIINGIPINRDFLKRQCVKYTAAQLIFRCCNLSGARAINRNRRRFGIDEHCAVKTCYLARFIRHFKADGLPAFLQIQHARHNQSGAVVKRTIVLLYHLIRRIAI
ncbi:hypothetical protein D3C78_1098700 [compost metagenome]